MIDFITLNRQYGKEGTIQFYPSKGGHIHLGIINSHAAARISLYGAQLLNYVPTNEQDLIWMSNASFYEVGKPIRGGTPLCFPWFGPHATDKEKPQHGFARLQYWNVDSLTETEEGGTRVVLSMQSSEQSKLLWPYDFKATAEFIVGSSMEVNLTVTNTGSETFEYSDALHTYFNISDIDQIQIEGLEGATYYEGFGTELKTQDTDVLKFDRPEETNRRYVNHPGTCTIIDPVLNRKIRVEKSGSQVTVVWNPWMETVKNMKDIHEGGFKNFVCVEPANAYAGIDMIRLEAGEVHTLGTKIGLLK